jgi:hypothetical protein
LARRQRVAGLVALGLLLLGVVLVVPRAKTPPSEPAIVRSDASGPPAPSPTPPPSASAPIDDGVGDYDPDALTIPEQRDALLEKMGRVLSLDAGTLSAVRDIISKSDWMSQGNPKITKRAMIRAECRERRRASPRIATPDPRCGAENMVRLTGPGAEDQSPLACIDQYEFPNVECEYPVVWVRANEASELCQALGKRLCDAHEWEGACAGSVRKPDDEYAWGERRVMMEHLHNERREIVWAYGREQNHALCATSSRKSPKCFAGGFTLCGTNDFPAGSFPDCVSPLGVYDQHGNAAEHMNLPMKPEELGSRGGTGQTEMKGSWFIFKESPAHPDDCRFRAPGWHASPVADENSHRNYHLGFRCCRDVGVPPAGPDK